ncbi:NUDIX domain-containing protein [Dechloromonas sp. H13]|uniref:NUDIX hydrolase n=1 Tax=Dechloromonas sp. H13 TaxID=2570193 RepID=UPI001290AFEE|nr:NUDIX domain-containing protein [Dechloromonas sp. H13]
MLTDGVIYPLVFADVALFSIQERDLCVLLARRANDPEANKWALPGGILKPMIDASLDQTAVRIIRDKVGVSAGCVEQVRLFSGATRDPRGYSLSQLYCALLSKDQVCAVAGLKTSEVGWVPVKLATDKELAFDHGVMLTEALQFLRAKIKHRALPLHLLNATFSLLDLQDACSLILGSPVDKSSFRRRMKAETCIRPVQGQFREGAYRPAQLYQATPDFQF